MTRKKSWNDSFGISYLNNLSLAEYKVLHIITTYAQSETGEFYPSNDTLAVRCHMHSPSIRRIKASLKKKNLILSTDKTKYRVPVLRLNLDQDGLINDGKNDAMCPIGERTSEQEGAHTAPLKERTSEQEGAHRALQTYNKRTISRTIIETGEGGKSLTYIEGSQMGKENSRKKTLGKSAKDLNPDLDLRGEKFKSPEVWNSTQLIYLWDSTYCQVLNDSAVVHSTGHRAYFKSQIEKSGIDMAVIAEAIEVVIEDWMGFYEYCNSYSLYNLARKPNLQFFARVISYAVDYAKEALKPKEEAVLVIYNPDGTLFEG